MIDLKFDNVSKKYRIRQESVEKNSNGGLAGKIRGLVGSSEDFWAVKNISFEVERGDTLGIIGHNGAGKSTILKLLANITAPSEGSITINGRLSALIEVGSGFHPELTGRENIYLNGSILGMRRSEISQKLDSIVEFAGLSQFLDTPVKRFSSGMYVRLGFSIAAHLNPDILLLDEVLAVGDAAFQKKCIERINQLKADGTTIVFISHDLKAVTSVCDKAILLSGGQVIKKGTSDEVVKFYESNEEHSSGSRGVYGLDSDNEAFIKRSAFYDQDGVAQVNFTTGLPLKAVVDVDVFSKIENAVVRIVIRDASHFEFCELTTPIEGTDLDPGNWRVEFNCDFLGLQSGIYFADASIRQSTGLESIHTQFDSSTIFVEAGVPTVGSYFQHHKWNIAPR